jgi:hypothetical protein
MRPNKSKNYADPVKRNITNFRVCGHFLAMLPIGSHYNPAYLYPSISCLYVQFYRYPEQFVYKRYPHQTPGVHVALFSVETYLYATDRKEGYVLRKPQCGLRWSTRYGRWDMKINVAVTQVGPVLFSTQHHAKKAHWGIKGIAPRILNLDRFIPKERAPGTHWIGG